jgi:hypothetical protein
VAALPIVVSFAGNESFRLPKEIVLRACAIVIAGAAAAAMLLRQIAMPAVSVLRDRAVAFAVAAVGWTAVTAAAATNVRLALFGLAYVACAAIVYLACLYQSGRSSRTHAAILIVLVPAAINSILAALQAFDIWSPFRPPPNLDRHHLTCGLLGNPDYVGVYLVGPTLLAIAAAAATSGRLRAMYAAFAIVLAGGCVVARSLTAIIGLAVAIVLLAFLFDSKRALVATACLVLAGAATTAMYPPLRQRVVLARNAVAVGDYDRFLSGRLAAFIAAWQMARDHPLLGVGPHCYHYEFFPYRLRLDAQYPSMMQSASVGSNFGEVHNDHLQVLAETGVPGFALLLAGFAFLAGLSRKNKESVEIRPRIARLLALPLSAATAVAALGQFPLLLSFVLIPILYMSALIIRWSDRA